MYKTKSITQEMVSPRTYLLMGLFVAGNVVLPQMFHLLNLGGAIFIPILFFTLYAAVRYGATVAILTAVLSPLTSHLLTGMPGDGMLTVLIVEGATLSMLSLFVFKDRENIGLKEILLVMIGYQLAGMLFQWALISDLSTAWNSLYVSLPGMAVHLFVIWSLLRRCTASKI